eukprot:5117753-Lingulodinium_polyedra.AAC.1
MPYMPMKWTSDRPRKTRPGFATLHLRASCPIGRARKCLEYDTRRHDAARHDATHDARRYAEACKITRG